MQTYYNNNLLLSSKATAAESLPESKTTQLSKRVSDKAFFRTFFRDTRFSNISMSERLFCIRAAATSGVTSKKYMFFDFGTILLKRL